MLGYVISSGRGEGDRLMVAVAEALAARGIAVAGAVQVNVERGAGCRCDMDLRVLGGREVLRISEDRGPHSSGCRLDPRGLAEAVQRVETALDRGAALLIVNKFGKAESEGGGFRAVIGKAMLAGVPVLTAVSAKQVPGFLAFAEGLGTELPADPEAVLAWCLNARALAA